MKRAEALDALGAILDPDACYDGPRIVITTADHGDAIRRMREAREALAFLRAARCSLETPGASVTQCERCGSGPCHVLQEALRK